MIDSGKKITLARPYAAAAFEYAVAQQAMPTWGAFLATAAQIANDAQMQQLFANPRVSHAQLADVFIDLLQDVANAEQVNFIHLLSENGRLPVLPEIVNLFTIARSGAEKKMTVTVTSAAALTAAYQQTLTAALNQRLARQVECHYTIDPDVLGGVIVRAGDVVIDGSIRGKLLRLNEFI